MPDADGNTILSDLNGPFVLQAFCHRCQRRALFTPAGLCAKFGIHKRWHDVRGKLACRKCGAGWPGGVTLTFEPANERIRDRPDHFPASFAVGKGEVKRGG